MFFNVSLWDVQVPISVYYVGLFYYYIKRCSIAKEECLVYTSYDRMLTFAAFAKTHINIGGLHFQMCGHPELLLLQKH